MIVTVTLNPAVDKTVEIARLVPGDVNRARSVVSMAAGKGINVARLLRQFHLPVAVMGFVGGYSGRMIEDAVRKLGAESHFTRVRGDTRTSTNLLSDDGYVTELLEPGPEISERELYRFKREFENCLELGELFVLCGSVPRGVPKDIYGSLIRRCREEGRKVFLDTSGEALREGIREKPFLIKPNLKELEYLVGRRLSDREAVVEEARKLVADGIEKVVVSMGPKGLLYVDGKEAIYQPAKKVDTVNTVGCGDSVVASLCMSETAGETPDIALLKAASLSAANASAPGTAWVSLERYLELLGG